MNTSNAFAFIITGLLAEALHFLPEVTGVREMWLMLMGVVLMLTGGVYLAQASCVWLIPRMVTPMLALLPSRTSTGTRSVPEGDQATV
ncbi:hypothetical protein [Rariglobus hedericola]|uniref:Uncharacterized protein n=1 Tax=Rariglobus hedericola TaxID=2597822 RepID=A0A556QKM6_9BACT|nr:hypothetical protein [Rariglobus hedericola]TSJ77188.1 hypothetical protein FPL22_13900 [Rariglobus hedericola]